MRKFVPRKKSFVPTSFCRRATLTYSVDSVVISVFFWEVGGREGVVDDFCQARKAENTEPRTNYRSFRNHYIFNSKTIFYVTVTVIFGKQFHGQFLNVTVPNSNCKEILPSDPQNCNCNGN